MDAAQKQPNTTSIEIMDKFREQVQSIATIEEFAGAADNFIKGNITKQEASAQMMSFLRGDLSPKSVERERLLELAAEVQPQCGTISITVLTVTSCTIVLSCTTC
jgi:hypothetical protein